MLLNIYQVKQVPTTLKINQQKHNNSENCKRNSIQLKNK